MDSHDIENYFRQHRKMLAVIFLMIGMLSVSGFFMGMLQTEKQTSQRYDTPHRTDAAAVPSAEDIPTAPKYGEIPKTAWLANRDWNFTLANLPRAAAAEKQPVAHLHDVGLVEDGDLAAPPAGGIAKGPAGNPRAGGLGGHLQAHDHVVGNLVLGAAVKPFGVFAHEDEVDVFKAGLDAGEIQCRADGRVKV